DRTGRVFSLLVFHLSSEHAQHSGEARLVAILARRLRIMDYLGRLGASRLGVVLPETQADGAQTLAEYVQHQFGTNPPRCDVYTSQTEYGSIDGPRKDGDEQSPRGGEEPEAAEVVHATGNGHSVEACIKGGLAGTRQAPKRSGNSIAVRPMELLFSRPL